MRRWGKIEKDFCTKNKTFDISKIPDIYDCIKYDLQHNQHSLQFEQAEELYINAKYLADIVIPQVFTPQLFQRLVDYTVVFRFRKFSNNQFFAQSICFIIEHIWKTVLFFKSKGLLQVCHMRCISQVFYFGVGGEVLTE